MAYWHQTWCIGSLHQDAAFGLLPSCLWSRSRLLLLQIYIQFPLNNFSLFRPIDTKLGACNWCNQSNGIIFSSLPSFVPYSCHIKTWLKRWKPGFVALRRFYLKYSPLIDFYWAFLARSKTLSTLVRMTLYFVCMSLAKTLSAMNRNVTLPFSVYELFTFDWLL